VETVPVSGFSLAEVGAESLSLHWLRGGFPLSFLAASETDSLAWRKNFVQMFLERDLPQWGVRIPAATLLRFWTMLAHYHGQTWNAAEPARSLAVSEPTIRNYLDVLEDVFMVRVLQPWYANIKKRQVKAPKIYFRDTGLLHYLLGIRAELDLHTHPRTGASWEGYAIEEVLKAAAPDEAYYWATHGGAELDLLLLKNGRRIGIECKRVDAPRLTSSMRSALQDLELDQLLVIYPGPLAYPLAEKISALPLAHLARPAPIDFTTLS
jgi:predicted AAA+ superfamily ATPase